jgi:hypothetical protein
LTAEGAGRPGPPDRAGWTEDEAPRADGTGPDSAGGRGAGPERSREVSVLGLSGRRVGSRAGRSSEVSGHGALVCGAAGRGADRSDGSANRSNRSSLGADRAAGGRAGAVGTGGGGTVGAGDAPARCPWPGRPARNSASGDPAATPCRDRCRRKVRSGRSGARSGADTSMLTAQPRSRRRCPGRRRHTPDRSP